MTHDHAHVRALALLVQALKLAARYLHAANPTMQHRLVHDGEQHRRPGPVQDLLELDPGTDQFSYSLLVLARPLEQRLCVVGDRQRPR
jgi:hypothetical protein